MGEYEQFPPIEGNDNGAGDYILIICAGITIGVAISCLVAFGF